jgi:hypothetical protein
MPPRTRRPPATPVARDAAGRFLPTPAGGGKEFLSPVVFAARRDATTAVELAK